MYCRRRRRQILVKKRNGKARARPRQNTLKLRLFIYIFREDFIIYVLFVANDSCYFFSARRVHSVSSGRRLRKYSRIDGRSKTAYGNGAANVHCALGQWRAAFLPVIHFEAINTQWYGLDMGAFSSWSVFIAHNFTYCRVEWTAHDEWMNNEIAFRARVCGAAGRDTRISSW